jgi:hypothetical protein
MYPMITGFKRKMTPTFTSYDYGIKKHEGFQNEASAVKKRAQRQKPRNNR